MNIRASLFKPGSFLTVVTNRPYTISADHPLFAEALNAWREKDYDALFDIIDRPALIERYSAGQVKVFDGLVVWNGKPVHNLVAERILEFINEGIDLKPIVNFLNDLMLNPSEKIRDQLFRFLEVNEMALTEDGGFLAYKLTRDDGKPYYQTESDIVYKVGGKYEMPREEVSESLDECGGPGYYFGNKGYWGGAFDNEGRYKGNGKMFLAKLMPSWVVSIPHKESLTKGRAYKMEIIAEYETVREMVHANRVVEIDSSAADNGTYGIKPSGQKYYNVRKGGKFVKKG